MIVKIYCAYQSNVILIFLIADDFSHSFPGGEIVKISSCLIESSISFSSADSAKIVDSQDPHSQASVRRVDGESQSQIERSVRYQMSSCEDSLAVSGSERETMVESGDRCDKKAANEVGKAVNVVSSTSLIDPISPRLTPSDGKARVGNLSSKTKQNIRQVGS